MPGETGKAGGTRIGARGGDGNRGKTTGVLLLGGGVGSRCDLTPSSLSLSSLFALNVNEIGSRCASVVVV